MYTAGERTIFHLWTDPITQIAWAIKDNGKLVDSDEAVRICHSGNPAPPLPDWLLPTEAEVRDIIVRGDGTEHIALSNPVIWVQVPPPAPVSRGLFDVTTESEPHAGQAVALCVQDPIPTTK